MTTVLVVDDRATNREIARATLDHGGYQVLEATEGHEALTAAKANHPDLVLTDILMPGMDGFQLVQELHRDPDTAAIPVLLYTSHYLPDEAQALAAGLGVATVLAKSADPQELLDAVAQALHAPPASDEPRRVDVRTEHLNTVNAKLLQKIGALDQSEARFQTMAEASPVGIILGDAHGLATYTNPRLSEIAHTAAEDLLGRGWLRCLSVDHRRALHSGPDGALAPTLDELRYREQRTLPGGQQQWLTIVLRSTRDSDNALTGFVAVIDDITAAVTAEQLRQAEEHDRQAEARQQVVDRFDSLSRLAGGVAHDFNNMLAVILTFDEMVKDAVADATGALLTDTLAAGILADLDKIAGAGQRAATLTHQLLAFGGQKIVALDTVDLNALVADARDAITAALGDRATLTTQLDPQLHRVRVDPDQLRQTLVSLAHNARDAMPAGGRLHLETSNVTTQVSGQIPDLPAGQYAHLAVTDDGQGMPADILAHAMEPFFTTRPPGQGNGRGLGLATCFGVTKQAGGKLTIDSSPGHGTTVHLYLPGIRQDPHSQPPTTAQPPADGLTVLLAEDEEDIRGIVTRILTRGGYQVLAGDNGREALTLAENYRGPIHVLLTDVVMPVMNGRELADALRLTRPETPVLYMSGYAAAIMTQQGLLEPGVTVLAKPFTKADLLDAVQTAVVLPAGRH